MKTTYVTLFLIFFLSPSQLLTNELSNQTSPYLLQHADNPVKWMAWGKKAFDKAKKENKAIFLSIGYATCHWCHIMEKESFRDIKIATLLNKYFISIKVDREELPQVDALYQKSYKQYYGHAGGWPLNVFLTPQKEVFYITNYIPPKNSSKFEGFEQLLPKLHQVYENKAVLKKSIDLIAHRKFITTNRISKISLESLVQSMEKEYQSDYQGFGRSSQFPESSKLALMLDLAQLSNSEALKNNYFAMLDVMALRGLYDHVNGGFFRYSVDTSWEIPHFEKMLYTQAELLPLYVNGYVLSHNQLYKEIVQETIAMLSRRFEQDSLYFSASDADSIVGEGAFFTFTRSEIKNALKNNPYAQEIEEAMEFSYEGNFHDKVHINFYTPTRPNGFITFQKQLKKVTQKRRYPFIDTKINTAWNAMMIEALYKASIIDKTYARKAEKHLLALKDMMFDKGELYHQNILGHKAKQKGLLEDYAFFIGALIAAYESGFDQEHLLFAEYLLVKAKQKFYKNGLWYLSDDGLDVKAGLNDKYYTSAQAKILQDIIKLAALKGSFKYEKLVVESMKKLYSTLAKNQADTPALARLYLMQTKGIVVIKSSEENLEKNRFLFQRSKYPYILLKAKEYDDYLACTLRQCFAKEKDLQIFLALINNYAKEH